MSQTLLQRQSVLTLFFLSIILILSFLAFLPSLENDFVAWDDPAYLIENPLVRDLSAQNVKAIFTDFINQGYHYHPLTILSYAVEYQFAGLNPKAYHRTNLILHLINIVLVFGLIYQLTGERLSGLVAALLFGIHPMNVESVAWVTARKNILFLFFSLNSLMLYARHGKTAQRISGYLITSFLMFFLALLSKPAAVVLPLLLLLVDYYQKEQIRLSSVIDKTPFFLLSLSLGLLILYDTKIPFENLYPIEQSFSLVERVMLVCYAFWGYLYKLLWPVDLSCYYPYPEKINGHLPFYFSVYVLFILLLLWVLGRFFRRNKTILFGFLFFVFAMSLNFPVSNVSFTVMADRFVYLPFLGLFLMISEGMRRVCQWPARWGEYGRVAVALSLIGLMLFYFAQTWNRCLVWKNNGILWNDVALKHPSVPLAYYFRGNYFYQNGQLDAAMADYNRAIQLLPNYFTAYNNRGVVQFLQGKFDLAIKDYNSALRYRPSYVPAYLNRAFYYLYFQEFHKAINDFDRILELDPGNHQALQGKNKAIESLERKQ